MSEPGFEWIRLSEKTRNILIHAGFVGYHGDGVHRLAAVSDESLLKLSNLGKKSVANVRRLVPYGSRWTRCLHCQGAGWVRTDDD